MVGLGPARGGAGSQSSNYARQTPAAALSPGCGHGDLQRISCRGSAGMARERSKRTPTRSRAVLCLAAPPRRRPLGCLAPAAQYHSQRACRSVAHMARPSGARTGLTSTTMSSQFIAASRVALAAPPPSPSLPAPPSSTSPKRSTTPLLRSCASFVSASPRCRR